MAFNLSVKHGFVFTILLPFFLWSCISECSDAQCPVRCANISFEVLQNGSNIIRNPSPEFPLDSIRVEAAVDPIAPPLLGFGERTLGFVACEGIAYKVYLNDSEVIDVDIEIATAISDACCDYFAASAIRFNSVELCSSLEECGVMTYEVP